MCHKTLKTSFFLITLYIYKRNTFISGDIDIIFRITPETTKEEVEQWLDKVKPTEIGSMYANNIWIHFYWEHSLENYEYKEAAILKLWQEAAEKSADEVLKIAKKTCYLQGKWIIKSESSVDEDWKNVVHGIMEKNFGKNILHATVDCLASKIRIITKNFADEQSVLQCETDLRRSGIRSKMFYRPSIFPLLKPDVMSGMYFSRYIKNGEKFMNPNEELISKIKTIIM